MPNPRSWVLIGSDETLTLLAPLISAHQVSQPTRIISVRPDDPISSDRLSALAGPDARSILWIGPAHQSPRAAVPGLFIAAADGRKIPIGWLPNLPDRLADYAQAAAGILHRSHRPHLDGTHSLALLGPRDDRSQDLIQQIDRHFQTPASLYQPVQWTADRIRQPDLQAALSIGLGAAIYVGHGFPNGWDGYGGVTFEGFAAIPDWNPIGALLCFTCHNASRHRVALSFAEEWVLSGRCGAAIAATGPTRHAINRVFADRVCQRLNQTVGNASTIIPTIADCIDHPMIQRLPLARYRILGDPDLPLLGSAGSIATATAVFAPAPGDRLPPLPASLWG